MQCVRTPWQKVKAWLRSLKPRAKPKSTAGPVEKPITERLTFTELRNRLEDSVKAGEYQTSNQLLQLLREHYPGQNVEIIPAGRWNLDKDQVVLRTHAKAEVEDAIDNVEYTGRAVSAQDKKQPRMIMSHWCGWSPTSAEHRNDPWMQHLRRTYLLPELQPILDTLTWPEEFAQYPPGRTAAHPSLFFLVTSTSYYIYNFVDFATFKVGDQLSDVVDGLQRERWIDGELWEEITGRGYEGAEDYFPVYYRVIQSD